MISLSIDTCDARGSIALRVNQACASARLHLADDYSSWLLPSVDVVLAEAECVWPSVDLLGVATGPGSFTGVRIGLTAVKAWSEVHRKPIIGVSRLQAMASLATQTEWVAATFDAHRGQLFAALYRRTALLLEPVDSEFVITASQFLALVHNRVGAEPVEWVAMDPEPILASEVWMERAALGDVVTPCSAPLAEHIGQLAEQRASRGQFTDPLALDANYVRRSDAEIFWKGATHV